MPDHLIDVKRAIAWTRQHAAGHGGDPDFIVLSGGSAGGHLTALATLTAHQKQWPPGFEQIDTAIQVAVPLYGKYDMLEALRRAMDPAAQAADPAAPTRPPFLVLHGDHDVLIPAAEAHWVRRAAACDLAQRADLRRVAGRAAWLGCAAFAARRPHLRGLAALPRVPVLALAEIAPGLTGSSVGTVP